MAIADFSIATEHDDDTLTGWSVRHGFAMALAGCMMFWLVVGTALYFAIHGL